MGIGRTNAASGSTGGAFDLVKVTSYTASPLAITGVKANNYVPATKTWTFDSTSVSFTGFEKTPIVNGIFAAKDTALIGATVGYADIISSDGLVFFAPLSSRDAADLNGIALTYGGSGHSFGTVDGIPCDTMSDGSNITFTPSDSFGTTVFSLSIWLRPSANSGTISCLGYGEDFSWHAALINIINGYYGIERASGQIASSKAATLDTWCHVAAVYDGTTLKIYADGTQVYSGAHSFTLAKSSGAIGSWLGGGSNAPGSYASARIYNRALTAAEITALAGEF